MLSTFAKVYALEACNYAVEVWRYAVKAQHNVYSGMELNALKVLRALELLYQ